MTGVPVKADAAILRYRRWSARAITPPLGLRRHVPFHCQRAMINEPAIAHNEHWIR